MTEKEKRNVMEDDMFVNDFVCYKTIKVQNRRNPEVFSEYKFGIKELTGFDEDRISKNAVKVDSRTKKMELNQAEANVKLIKLSLVEAPFAITEDNIRKLSKKIRNELLEFITEINEVSGETETGFLVMASHIL